MRPSLFRCCLLTAVFLLPGLGPALHAEDEKPEEQPKPAAMDLYGDPLPPGAVARLGTLRLRHPGMAAVLAFGPKGRSLVAAGYAGVVDWIDPTSGKTLRRRTLPVDWVYPLRVLDEDRVLAAGVRSTTVLSCWEMGKDGLPNKLSQSMESFNVEAAEFSADGKLLASVTFDGGIQVREAATGKELHRFAGPRADANASVAFSPDGKSLAVGCSDRTAGSLRLWDLATGKDVPLLTSGKNELHSLAFSPDGKMLAVGSYFEGVVRLWEVGAGKELRQLPKEFGVRVVAFSPDGKTVAYAGEGGEVHLHEADTGKESGRLRAGSNTYSLAFAPDGKTLAASMSLFYQGTTRLWDLATGRELLTWPRHEQRIDTVAYSADGAVVVTAGVDQTVRVWDAATGKHLFQVGETQLTDEREKAPPCVLSADGKVLAVAKQETITFWDVKSRKELRRFQSLEAAVVGLSIAPDGKTFASLSVDRERAPESTDTIFHYLTLHVRDAETGKALLSIPRLPPYSGGLSYSPDGKLLAVAEDLLDNKVTLYDATTGKAAVVMEAPDKERVGVVRCLAFSPDGRVLAAASPRDRTVHFWDPATGKLLRTVRRPTAFVESISFSPDGKLLAAVGGDERCLVEVASGRVLWKNDEPGGPFQAVAFSPDGKRVVTGAYDGTGLVWELKPDLIKP